MTQAIALSVGMSVFFIMQLFLTKLGKDRVKIEKRMESLMGVMSKEKSHGELDIPFFERVVKPLTSRTGIFIERVTPQRIVREIALSISRAGAPCGMTQGRWIFIRLSTGLVLPLLIGAYILASMGNSANAWFSIIGIAGFTNALPRIWLANSAKERKQTIEHELPDALDLITVCVEAGISFDSALGKIVEKTEGPLSDEFKKTIGEMRLGSSKKQALSAMGGRCDVSELTSFLAAVMQADELGVPITNVLRVQSVQMREKRKQKAQEKAMKAPVKILFPLLFFIFPSIFVVILGPSVIRLIDIFGR